MTKKVYVILMHYFLGTRKPYVFDIETSKTRAEKSAQREFEKRGGGWIPEIVEIVPECPDTVKIYKSYGSKQHGLKNIEDIYNPLIEKV